MKTETKHTGQSQIERTITIGKPADELYDFWRDPFNLVQIMSEMIQMTPKNNDKAHWKIKGALGTGMEWDARIADEMPGKSVTWQSIDREHIKDLHISFSPAPAEWGTEVKILFQYHIPGSAVGEALAKLFGMMPDTLIGKMLRRFKALVETGEMPTLEYNVSNREQAEQAGEQK